MPPKKGKNKLFTRIKTRTKTKTEQCSQEASKSNDAESEPSVKRRRGRPASTDVLPIKRGRGRPPATAAPIKRRRGRQPSANNKTQTKVQKLKRTKSGTTSHANTLFSFKEKKAFYDCLTDHGFSAIHDFDLLTEVLPDRSENEIEFLIKNYSRKAREANKKRENEVSDNGGERQPLDKWYDIINNLVPNPSRKMDMSSLFPEIFEEIAKEYHDLEFLRPSSSSSSSSTAQMRPNYGRIYYYISELLSQKFPQELEPIDAYTFLKLIEDLKESFTKDSDINKEVAFTSEEKWSKRGNNSAAADYQNSLYLERQRQNADESRMDASNGSETDNMDECGDNHRSDDKSLVKKTGNVSHNSKNHNTNSGDGKIADNFTDLPKIRKIVDCLNPIQVPVSLLKDERTRWLNVLYNK